MDDDACGVCVYGGDDDLPAFSTDREVVGRKPHECCECRRLMPKGERQEVCVGKWDGEFHAYRTCLVCVEIRNTFCCDGWTYTMLWEYIAESELFERFNEACVAQLATAGAKALLRERWLAWKGLAVSP